MLRKSLTVATVVGAGSQAVAAGFRHAFSLGRLIPRKLIYNQIFKVSHSVVILRIGR